MKKLIPFLIVMFIITISCENNATKSETSAVKSEVTEDEYTVVDLVNFNEKAETLVGKHIVLNGMIDHVCKHGGQKMFIVNQNADARVKVVTGEDMAAFNTELEGETVSVVGIVDELRIDEDYLREWEEEVLAGLGPEEGEKAEKVHMGEGEGEHHEEGNADLMQINKYREKIANSEKDYISFFTVVCVNYKVEEVTTEEGV